MDVRSRVLVVEDEARLRRLVAGYLAGRGHEVAEAGSLAEARTLLARRPFDALVVDVGLPDGDGLDLVHDPRVSRALVITARPDPERFARSGVRHHLEKPLDLGELARRIEVLAAA